MSSSFAGRVRAVAVAGQAVPAGEQRRAGRGERPLAGAAEQRAGARIGHREARAVAAGRARRGGLHEHDAGEHFRILLCQRAGHRGRRRRAGHRIREQLHRHAEARGLDDGVAHAGPEVERADRREAHVESAGGRPARFAAGRRPPRCGDSLGHLREVPRLPGEVEARAADVLVRLGVDREVRVQRVKLGGHVRGRDQRVDAVRVAAVVHDARREDLVAQGGAA